MQSIAVGKAAVVVMPEWSHLLHREVIRASQRIEGLQQSERLTLCLRRGNVTERALRIESGRVHSATKEVYNKLHRR